MQQSDDDRTYPYPLPRNSREWRHLLRNIGREAFGDYATMTAAARKVSYTIEYDRASGCPYARRGYAVLMALVDAHNYLHLVVMPV